MRSTAAALTLILAATAGHAQEAEPPEVRGFRDLAASIPADPGVADQWMRLLPTIARKCGMTVDREHAQAVGTRSPVQPPAEHSKHRSSNALKAAWDAMAKRDLDEACRTADGLWGESGTAFPDVLRDKAEGSLPVSLASAAIAP